jgi:hypothetical protein
LDLFGRFFDGGPTIIRLCVLFWMDNFIFVCTYLLLAGRLSEQDLRNSTLTLCRPRWTLSNCLVFFGSAAGWKIWLVPQHKFIVFHSPFRVRMTWEAWSGKLQRKFSYLWYKLQKRAPNFIAFLLLAWEIINGNWLKDGKNLGL